MDSATRRDRVLRVIRLGLISCTVLACDDPRDSPAEDGGGGAGAVDTLCPDAPGRWPMVAVPNGLGGQFCIDSREATNDQYRAFLDSGTSPALNDACIGVADFTPMDLWPPALGRENDPVVAITWCQAEGFCRSAGKRLCGDSGTGMLREYAEGVSDDAWELSGEMFLACSRGGTQAFAYGNQLEPGRCNESGPALPADTETKCEGGYAGIYFLQGNVAEWEAACDFDVHFPTCSIRGMLKNDSGCRSSTPDTLHGAGVYNWSPTVGVRCCADALL